MNRCLKIKVRGKRLSRQLVSAEARFIAKLYLLLLGLFSVQRVAMAAGNPTLLKPLDVATLVHSFAVGLRFDLATTTYLLAPLFLLLVASYRSHFQLRWALPLLLFFLILSGIAELAFYRVFECRFNALVFDALRHPLRVGSLIWQDAPVIGQILCAVVVLILLWPLLPRILRPLWQTPPGELAVRDRLGRTMGNTLFIVLMVFAMRGGFQHEPLRPSDAYFSENPFANQLALNGLFTLGRTGWENIHRAHHLDSSAPPENTALASHRTPMTGEELVRTNPRTSN